MKHVVSFLLTGLFFFTSAHAGCPYGGNKCKAGMSSWEQAEFFGPKLDKLKENPNINNTSIQQKNTATNAIINAYGQTQSYDGNKYKYIFQNIHAQKNADGTTMDWRNALSQRLNGLNSKQLSELQTHLQHQLNQR